MGNSGRGAFEMTRGGLKNLRNVASNYNRIGRGGMHVKKGNLDFIRRGTRKYIISKGK